MLRLRSRNQAACLLFLSAMTVGSFAAEREQRNPLDVCITASQAHFAILRFGENVVTNQCECVRDRRQGRLPRSVAEWAKTGKGSANMAYVECAKSDIISFYSAVVLKSEMELLEKKGLAQDDHEIQKAEDLSACVGEGSYEEVRRVAATASAQPGRLDKPKFVEMYGRCLRAANQTN